MAREKTCNRPMSELHYERKIDPQQGPIGVLLLRKAHDEIVGTPNHPKESDQVPSYFWRSCMTQKSFLMCRRPIGGM